MKVEIWSDVVCPFCYIGKRRFENALDEFDHKEDVEIIWHSFELDPDREYVPGRNINQMLAEAKGWSVEEAKRMNERVTQMAEEVGLTYDFDKAVPVNTFNAHRISHLAAKHGVQGKMEELLFSAYFTKGINIGDNEALEHLAQEVGIDNKEVKEVLESDEYSLEVRNDEEEARQIGVNGVPFFVFDRKYAVSGAQSEEVFLKTLETVWAEDSAAENAS